MKIDDLFDIVVAVFKIYRKHAGQAYVDLKPSDAPKILQNLLETLKSGQAGLSKAENMMNKWSWVGIDQNLINQVREYRPILIAATEILNDIKENVIKSPISETILKEMDKFFVRNKYTISLQKLGALLDEMETVWKRDEPYTPSFDPLKNEFEKNPDKLA